MNRPLALRDCCAKDGLFVVWGPAGVRLLCPACHERRNELLRRTHHVKSPCLSDQAVKEEPHAESLAPR